MWNEHGVKKILRVPPPGPMFESNGSYFRSEYQSNKEYMPFLPVLIKLKSRENNNLVFIVSHVI